VVGLATNSNAMPTPLDALSDMDDRPGKMRCDETVPGIA
jgi:hypothetical protein